MSDSGRRVVFTAAERACVEPFEFSRDCEPDAVIMRTHWTLISPGTELAVYTNTNDLGRQPGNQYPAYPGYAAEGMIEAAGETAMQIANGLVLGSRVMSITAHASHVRFKPATTFAMPIPDDLPFEYAPFIRMALIPLAALVKADIRPGEWLGVVGLGLVGNLGAQFGLAEGYHVIGVGRSRLRGEIASKCGVEAILRGDASVLAAETRTITGGEGCRFVLETTGTEDGLQKAIALAGDGGTVSLVGVPWQVQGSIPVAAVMQPIFSRYLTLRGGWEWDLPLYSREPERAVPMIANRHSIEANARYAAACMTRGGSIAVKIEPLITHRLKPGEVQRAYQGLLRERDNYLGVLIDWRDG